MEASRDAVYRQLMDITGCNPVLIVGSGASQALDADFGMPALTTALTRYFEASMDDLQDDEKRAWIQVRAALQRGSGLEQALTATTMPEQLLERIVATTGHFVASVQRKVKTALLEGIRTVPLQGLLEDLADEAEKAGGDRALHVVTTNYDTLIEQACDRLGVPVCTGFVGHTECRFDWEAAMREMESGWALHRGGRAANRYRPHVRLYKPHGSLDWFRFDDGLYADASVMYATDNEHHRQIVTPGKTKHEAILQGVFRDIIRHADEALQRAKAYLFVGYGFNDDRIDTEIVVRRGLKEGRKPGLIITRGLTDKMRERLHDPACPNLWAVHRDEQSGHTRVRRGDEVLLDDPETELWRIDVFARELFGKG